MHRLMNSRKRRHGLGLILGLLTVCSLMAPMDARAIPSSGDYLFTSGSGLTGTFTILGQDLTAYTITVDTFGVNFTPNNSFDLYKPQFDATSFGLDDNTAQFQLDWGGGSYQFIIPNGATQRGTLSYTRLSVPEPPSALLVLAGLGLLGLVGYGQRQRRQAGLQVG